MIKVKVQAEDFNINEELKLIKDANIGALVSFIGLVRDVDNKLDAMILEHYPKMTKKSLKNIANQASNRWDISNIIIIHRFGKLKPKDNIVLVITTSSHRKDAFLANEFIMDYLKTKAPFWKKEIIDNNERWVESKSKDIKKANSW